MTLQNAFENLAVESKQDAAIVQLSAAVAALADLDINTDDLESGIAALVASLADVDVNTDQIEAKLDALTTAVAATTAAVTAQGPLTNAQLRAAPVPISGTVAATGGLTDTELRAAPIPVSVPGSVEISNDIGNPVPVIGAVTGPLTDTQLRAAAVPVSGPLTNTELRAAAVPVSGTVAVSTLTPVIKAEDAAHANADSGLHILGVRNDAAASRTSADGDYGSLAIDSAGRVGITTLGGTLGVTGPLTDAQIRATPLPVTGTVATGGLTDTQLRAAPVPVSGPLTDTQLRANPVPVSGPLTDAQLRATRVPVLDVDASTKLDGIIARTGITPFQAHGQTAVGTTAAVLNGSGTAPVQGILVKASIFNSNTVYVGRDNGVTIGNGFELAPGEANLLPAPAPNQIWLISASAAQVVSWEMF